MKRVCVLISTYNGEKYLEEQLESIVSQKDVEVDILVRDDGSKDDTKKILDTWTQKSNLKWYQGENLGFALSFLDLVKNASDYDYYDLGRRYERFAGQVCKAKYQQQAVYDDQRQSADKTFSK